MENSALYELFIIITPKTFLPYHLRGNMRLTGKVIVWHQGKGSTQPLMVTIKVPRVHQPTLRTYVDNVFCSISCLVLTGGSCPMHWRRRLSSWTNAFLLVLTSQRLCRGTCLNALASCGWSQNLLIVLAFHDARSRQCRGTCLNALASCGWSQNLLIVLAFHDARSRQVSCCPLPPGGSREVRPVPRLSPRRVSPY